MKRFLLKIKSSILYHIALIYLCFSKDPKFNILSDDETLEKIINEKLSVARFGDGEFNGIFGNNLAGFQDKDDYLTQRLKDILKSKHQDLLVGIPRGLIDVSGYSKEASKFWAIYSLRNKNRLLPYLGDREFINASFTRPYIDYKNKDEAQGRFESIKMIWENKNLVVIEGSKTKFGVGNDLLDNALSVRRIICPSKNAFVSYDRIYKATIQNISTNCLILISLGPTATVLTYDLSKIGYQAIDIGHLDVEYEWYLQGAKKKISLRGKNVNEVRDNLSTIEIVDKKYEDSIILNLDN